MTGIEFLLAQAKYSAESAPGRPTYYWGRAEHFDDPRYLWAGVAVAISVFALFVIWQYRREATALTRGLGVFLAALRLTAIAGALVFFLAPMKRNDQQVTTESRVVILVDTSQSMSVEDEQDEQQGSIARIDATLAAISRSPLISQLRQRHDVALASFDSEVRRILQWKRRRDETDSSSAPLAEASPPTRGASGAPKELAADQQVLKESLQATGVETRLGDALQEVLADPSDGPLAGVLTFSDGGQNLGVDPLSLVETATQRKAQLITIGVGSTDPRRNVGIEEIVAPSRAFPNDKAIIRAIVASQGFAGRTFQVELFAREEGGASVRVDAKPITIAVDDAPATVEFNLEPAKAGRLDLEARIAPPPEDQYKDDNQRTAELDVVEETTNVLLIASGATRDYRFLRSQLQRDDHTSVDVLLQLSPPGISQDADKILAEFPSDKEALFKYDAIIAFDPDWTRLDAQQVELLEQWVADEAGGMIVVAGPVHTASWLQSSEHAKLRSLYPVEFQRRLTMLDDGLFGSKQPWPIELTREGIEADFLWIGDTASESRQRWAQFPGVYGCYAVKGAKPGAQVYGRYGDPEAGISDERPIYWAEHFYGAGRVFYMGSGELWRLRSLDPGYFEQLYTQLVRHVSEGRLLRGSSQGRLLVERDRYFVGDTVAIRAQLTTSSHEPYVATRVPARISAVGQPPQTLPLLPDPTRPGNFVGQFTIGREGSYRVEVSPPDVPGETLLKRITATVPDLEFAETRRNEPLLAALASRTGGRHYASIKEALEGAGNMPRASEILQSRAQTKTLRGKPDDRFARRVHAGMLAVICGALSLEWLTRRLARLA